MTTRPTLEAKDLSRHFDGLVAVDSVSFDTAGRPITALIGPNGAGKSTILDLLSGHLRAKSGEVFFDGIRTSDLAAHQIAELDVSRTFQNLQLFPDMTVEENVLVGRHRRIGTGMLAGALSRRSAREEEERARSFVNEMLAELGLDADRGRGATELPFGRQRLVELARALASEPRMLLLDEPAAGLNVSEANELGFMLGQLTERGISILLVEHNMRLVMGVADHIVCLDHGAKIFEGTAEQARNDHAVIEAYLGVGASRA